MSLAAQRADLAALAASGRGRALAPRAGVDFASNDYLGLAGSDALRAGARAALDRGVPLGSGGSRLLRGNHAEHEALEAEAAVFFGGESALFFPTGYAANAALLATLPQRADMVFADALVHASSHEGLRQSRAGHQFIAHNDVDGWDRAIGAWRQGGGTGAPWIVVESLYSMDGDFAPLAALAAIARRHDGVLVVDEAHATGVFGPAGRGLVAEVGPRGEGVITLHTLGKALGAEGALLVGPRVMRDHLVNRARGFIFSTAPSPLMAAVARAALALGAVAEDRRTALMRRIAVASDVLGALGAACHGAPILPLIIGADAATMARAAQLRAAGFDVRGIRPPTVPEGSARLRIAITLNASEADIRALAQILAEVFDGAPAEARR